MSAARFTPGPWHAGSKSVTAPETEDRCPLDVRLFGGNSDDHRANARLIAMAPTMLEALVEAAGALQGAAQCMRKVDAPKTADKLEEIALAAMLVIAKATGSAA